MRGGEKRHREKRLQTRMRKIRARRQNNVVFFTVPLQLLQISIQFKLRSETTDVVVAGISLAVATMLGLKQNGGCVKSPVSELLSAIVIFGTRQILSLQSSKLECSSD